jgi:hypothetical protein
MGRTTIPTHHRRGPVAGRKRQLADWPVRRRLGEWRSKILNFFNISKNVATFWKLFMKPTFLKNVVTPKMLPNVKKCCNYLKNIDEKHWRNQHIWKMFKHFVIHSHGVGLWENKKHTFRWALVGWKFIPLSTFRYLYSSPLKPPTEGSMTQSFLAIEIPQFIWRWSTTKEWKLSLWN